MVRDFVRGQRRQRRRVTGAQVLDFLVAEKLLHIHRDANNVPVKKACETAHRNMRRVLESHGHERGKRKGNVGMTATLKIKRNKYLRFFFRNRAH